MNNIIDFQYQVSRIERHLGIDNSKKSIGINLGKDESFLSQKIIKNWIAVIYDLVKKAKRIHQESNEPNEDQKKIFQYRLFSFSEYKNLFISYGSNKELRSLAASQFLGIKRPTDTNRILFGLQPNEQDYQFLLRKYSPKIPQTNFLLVDYLKANFQNNAHVTIDELKKGAAIIAGSGSGKTTLLSSVLHSLIENSPNSSFVIIDPHGHLTEMVSKFKFDDRQMFFSLKHFNLNQSIFSLNVLDIEITNDNELGHAVDNIVDAISELPTLDGHRVSENMYSVLTYCIKFLLLKVEKPTLIDLFNLLNKEEKILRDAQNFNPYFKKRFLSTEASSRDAARRRVENAIKNEVMKEILCTESSFDMEKAINGNKILLFDLSSLSSYASIAFGKFLIANIKNLVRARGANTELVTFLAIDEAPVFVGKGRNYEDILSQKRKFGLHTILSAQYANQFGAALETVKHNTSVKIIAGENPKDFSSFVSVPNNFLRKDIDGNPINLLSLKQYQFILSNKNQTPIKFQADDKVIVQNGIFSSEEEHNKFLDRQYKS